MFECKNHLECPYTYICCKHPCISHKICVLDYSNTRNDIENNYNIDIFAKGSFLDTITTENNELSTTAIPYETTFSVQEDGNKQIITSFKITEIDSEISPDYTSTVKSDMNEGTVESFPETNFVSDMQTTERDLNEMTTKAETTKKSYKHNRKRPITIEDYLDWY